MVERGNNVLMGGQERAPEAYVQAITTIWLHALYPDSALTPGS